VLEKVFARRGSGIEAGNENLPAHLVQPGDAVAMERLRALATGAALAVDVDNSPAVLVSIQAYAQRYREKGRRTA
jgi:hypothetical protein